jgi:T5SS/PEP-CTERM-associated repeat protein
MDSLTKSRDSIVATPQKIAPFPSRQIFSISAFLFLTLISYRSFSQSLLLDQSFENSTAPNWVLQGSAELTSGTIDPNGAGWLRLTPTSKFTTGFAYLNQAVPFGFGIDIKIQYQTWGGTGTSGADGIALDLFNGTVLAPTAGAFGGSLGYAQELSGKTLLPGLTGGIAGIGLDEHGNFANPSENRVGGPGREPNSITIRGPGDGTGNATNAIGAPNYGFLDSINSPFTIQTGLGATTRPTGAANVRTAQFIIGTNEVSEGLVPVTVILSDGTSSDTVINQFNIYNSLVQFYGSAANIPSTFKIGFTSSTGALNNIHEIRGLFITTLQTAPGFSPIDAGSGIEDFVALGTAAWETGTNWNSGVAPALNDDVYVDNGGNALLTSSASVMRLDVAAGSNGASGGVTIQGLGGNLAVTTDVSVGANGSATLSVTGGGTLTDSNGIIGELVGSVGTATIAGTGSTWVSTGNLAVGQSGMGTLTIQTGGTVSAGSITLGSNAGSTGTLNISAGGLLRVGGTNGLAAGAGTAVLNFAGVHSK